MKIRKYPTIIVGMLEEISNLNFNLKTKSSFCSCGPINDILKRYEELIKDKYSYYTDFYSFIYSAIVSCQDDGRTCNAYDKQRMAKSLLKYDWVDDWFLLQHAIRSNIASFDETDTEYIINAANTAKSQILL